MPMAVTYYCLGDSDQKTLEHVWYRLKNIPFPSWTLQYENRRSGEWTISHNQRNAGAHSLLVFLFWWCIKSCLLLLRGVLEWVEGGDPPACSSWAGPLKKCIPWWIWEHGHRRHWLRTHSNKNRGLGLRSCYHSSRASISNSCTRGPLPQSVQCQGIQLSLWANCFSNHLQMVIPWVGLSRREGKESF